MRRRAWICASALLVAIAAAAPAAADPEPTGSSVVAAAGSTSASAHAPPTATPGIVRLTDRKVFTLQLDRAGRSAFERARSASQALERAFHANETEVHVERTPEGATIFVGKTSIVALGEDDARAAGAASLDAHASDVAAQIQSAIGQEKRRSDTANTVFSFSLVVFAGLVAFLALGKLSQLGARARTWGEENPEKIPSLRFGGIELLRPAALEAFLGLGIGIGQRIAQLGVLYAYAIFSLSLFEATKGYTGRLTAMVVEPVSGLVARIGAGLPLAVVTAIAALSVALLVRFTGVFFAGIARGETTLDWVPRDLAPPVSVVVRIGIVVAALLLAAPLLTGTDDGALSRAGLATLLAFGLAATPVLACGIAGAIVVFQRRLRPGDFVELGERTGRIHAVTLLEIVLEDASGCEVRVPHLLALWNPTRVMGASPTVSVELVVDPRASQVRVREVLCEAAAKVGSNVKVDLVAIDADGALHRVTVGVAAPLVGPLVVPAKRVRTNPDRASGPVLRAEAPESIEKPKVGLGVASSVQLGSLLADALAREGIALGRRPSIPMGRAS